MGYGTDLGRCSYCSAKTLSGQAPHRAQCPTLTIERLRADLAAAEAEVVALRAAAIDMQAACDAIQVMRGFLGIAATPTYLGDANKVYQAIVRAHQATTTEEG